MMSVRIAEAPPRGALRYQLDSGASRLTPAERVVRGKFARAYADQNERDHQALLDAVASGRIFAERDL